MNGLQLILHQPWTARAGWTLVHFFWQGSVAAILLAAARALVGRLLTARARYAMSCGALALMTAAPVVTFPLLSNAPVPVGPHLVWRVATSAGWDRLLPWLVVIWVAGVMLFSARLVWGWHRAERLRKVAVGPAPAEWQIELDGLLDRLRVSTPVRLLASSLAPVPAVVGWLRPVILMPVEALAGVPLDHVRALLAHELAHIRRHDYLVNIVQSLAEALLFYHPAVWWVSGQIRMERELCCDDLAVEACGDALAYATALADVATYRRLRAHAAMAATGGSLTHRIRRLLGIPQPAPRNLPGPAAVWALTLLWLAGIGGVVLHAAPAASAHPARVALRRFVPAGIAPAPALILEAPPKLAAVRLPSLRSALLFDPFFMPPQAPAPPQEAAKAKLASVSGVVRNSAGQPIANATVQLWRVSPSSGSTPAGTAPPLSSHTAADGRFALDAIPPGSYTIFVSHPSYVDSVHRQGTLNLGEGRAQLNIEMQLSEPGTVSGKVVDEDGDPIASAMVQVMRPIYPNGRRAVTTVASASSADNGQFTVARVPPGKYYLRVASQPSWTAAERAPVPNLKPGQKDVRPSSTYYGGGHEFPGATLLDVGSGHNVAVGPVKMLNQLRVHVRGKVLGDSNLLRGMRVVRVPTEPGAALPWSYGADVQKDGSFDLAHLWNGSFLLAVMSTRMEAMGWRELVVGDEDMNDVVIDARAAPLRGVVKLDGSDAASSAGFALERAKVALITGANMTRGTSVNNDGSFTVPLLGAGKYIVQAGYVTPLDLPAGYYLKAARLGSLDVLEQALAWTGESADTLELVISAHAAAFDGVVRDGDGKPVPDATVTLVPASAHPGLMRFYPTATADQSGSFHFASVIPGKYKAYAWERIENGAHANGDFVKPFEGRGEAFSVDEGCHASASLTRISEADMNEALRRAGL